MAELTDKQKRYAVIGAAGLFLLYLLYHYYAGSKASNQASTGAGVAAPDTSGSDYAALAGQEQGDVASLQSQIAGLASQLTGTGAGTGAADPGSSTTNDLVGRGPFPADYTNLLQGLESDVAALGTGSQPVNRTTASATVTTHRGGAFYNYYTRVTGHAPPATVQASNWIYSAWRQGVGASRIATPQTHPSASHQTHVAHPNGNHQAQTQVAHPNTQASHTAPAPHPAPPPPSHPAPTPAPHPAAPAQHPTAPAHHNPPPPPPHHPAQHPSGAHR
jgi:hypothetical protein